MNIDLLKIPAKLTIGTIHIVLGVSTPHNKKNEPTGCIVLHREMARGDQRERDRAKKQARLLKEAGGGKKVRSLIWMCCGCDMCMMMEIPSNRCNKFSIFIFRSVWLAVCFMCAHVHRLVCILLHCDCIAYIYPPLTNHTQINRDEQNKYELHIVS